MSDIKDYVDLRVDELKLRTTQGLSLALSRLATAILLIALMVIVMGTMAVAGIAWLTELLGSFALASSIVCGFFALVLLIVLLLRKRLFRDSFVKMFIQIFYGNGKA